MAEYIKREDVLKILSEKNAPWNGYVKCKELPAEDVQPVRQGKWIFIKPPDDWVMSLYACDKCGHVEEGKPNYCPNCGARMDGVNNA